MTANKKTFWSHNGEDDWQTAFELIDQDRMFFDEEGRSVIYRATGLKLLATNLIDQDAIECILSEIVRSGHESRETHDHYIPDYWLEDFAAKAETKCSLKKLITQWLESNGQTDYYTMCDSIEVPVKRVGDELIEIETEGSKAD